MAELTTTDLGAQLKRLLSGDPELKADPYPLYKQLREESPVYDLGHIAVLTSYEVVKNVLLDTDRFSNEVQRPGTSRVEASRAALSTVRHRDMFDHCIAVERLFLEELDGEEHTRRRDICRRLFTPREIGRLERATEQLADDLLDELADAGEVVDFEPFAARLPAMIVADLLGVPRDDADQLGDWAATILANIFGGQGTAVLEAGYEAHRRLEDYIDGIVRDHRGGRRPTQLLAALLDAQDSDILTREELYAFMLELELGGAETTRGLIVGLAYELLRRPDRWRALVDDPSLTVNTVEEGVRYVSPVQFMARVAREDLELDGVPIAADTACLTMVAAANRDPSVFTDPDTFDIERANARHHLGFGFGRHYCLAQALARMEARIAFHALATRFPHAALAVDPDDVEWAGQAQLRRVKSLPVRLGPDAGGGHGG